MNDGSRSTGVKTGEKMAFHGFVKKSEVRSYANCHSDTLKNFYNNERQLDESFESPILFESKRGN